jgi:hypothetical protein
MPPLDLGCHRPDIADVPDYAAQCRLAELDVGVAAADGRSGRRGPGQRQVVDAAA